MAIPVSNKATIELLPLLRDCERKKTKLVDNNAPKHAARGNVHLPTLNPKVAPKAKYKAAPKAAPQDVPISPGSTIGFLKSACNKVPPTAKLAPTKMQRMARGKRISIKIRSVRFIESDAVKNFFSEEIISSIEIETAP